MPSKQVPFRLTDKDRQAIGRIQKRMGLPSAAAAVRFAVQRTDQWLGQVDDLTVPPRKPKGKRGG